MANINTKELHRRYIQRVRDKQSELKAEIETLKRSEKYIRCRLNYMKEFISNFCDASFDEILNVNNKHQINNLKFDATCKVKSKIKPNQVRTIIFAYLYNKREIIKIEKEINKLEELKIPYMVYRAILHSFNEKITDAIVKDGYVLRMGFNLGKIRIRRKIRKGRPINWGESNKLKQLLIEEGRVPYNKETAPDGEKWFIHHDSEMSQYWYWSKYACTIRNRDLYSFSPTAGETGNIKKLHQYVKMNPLAVFNYI